MAEYITSNYEVNNTKDIGDALKEMFKNTFQAMLDAKFNTHRGYEKSDNIVEKENYRNANYQRNVKSEFRNVELEMSRDRNSDFESGLVPKNSRDISGIKKSVISLYGRQLSIREITETIRKIYKIELPPTMISNITDAVLTEIEEWQTRTLNPVYLLFFIDAVHFNVKQDNAIVKKAAYVI